MNYNVDTNFIDLLIATLARTYTHSRFAQRIHVNDCPSFAKMTEMARNFNSEMTMYKQSRQPPKPATCSCCGKRGHLENDCFKKRNDKPNQQNIPQKQSSPVTTCTYCNRHGHTEATCYKKENDSKHKPSTNRSRPPHTATKDRPKTVNWGAIIECEKTLTGTVNEEVEIVVDTGAQITIVPGSLVYRDQLTGEQVPILGVHGDPVQYELAKVPITLNDMSIEETVAIAPEEQMNTRVLLSVSLNQEETSSLATKAMARKGTDNSYSKCHSTNG